MVDMNVPNPAGSTFSSLNAPSCRSHDSHSGFYRLPAPRKVPECLCMDGPVMQGCRIKVRSVWPYQRFNLTVNTNLVKQFQVAQWAEQFPSENRAKIDRLLGVVVKMNAQNVSGNDFERANSINRMVHSTTYFNGSMGAGLRPPCSRCQSTLNSVWCNSAHASTRRLCRRGSEPAINSTGSILKIPT
jgi:hypothetical protein